MLRLRGSRSDPHDRSKWHTCRGILSVNGAKFINWNRGAGGGGAIVELAGTGFADEVEPGLCESLAAIGGEFDLFEVDFGIADADFDGDGLPEEFALALVEAACSLQGDNSLRIATMNAFQINLTALSGEEDFSRLHPYRHGLGALMLVSEDTQNTLELTLLDAGIALTGVYETVRESGGVFMPSAVQGSSLAQAYEIFDESLKSASEPYSATGDFDGDGWSNLSEYMAFVVDTGGGIESFVNAATDAAITPSGSEGEGEGPPPLCGSLRVGGEPISGSVGDLALLTLIVGTMLLHRQRKSTPRHSNQ